MEFSHTPVLLRETLDMLAIRADGIYADGTLGGGGHSLEIARRLGDGGRLICTDRDAAAIEAARRRLGPYSGRVHITKAEYTCLPAILDMLGIRTVDGILLDLGVSSHQLDEPSRGFSYMKDAPLDMRMDNSAAKSAEDIVNTYTEGELAHILRTYGEEQFATRIAHSIVSERLKAPIRTTGQLAQIVTSAIPQKNRKRGGHPCKRTFQALRIETNGELEQLEDAIGTLLPRLSAGGRFAIITFHSLEDRIVKERFRKAENPCTCPPEFPVCVCGKKSLGRVVTRRPVTASQGELEKNPRAKSAKLRVFEHI